MKVLGIKSNLTALNHFMTVNINKVRQNRGCVTAYADGVLGMTGKNDVFGDAVWKENETGQAVANVRALTYCDIHQVNR